MAKIKWSSITDATAWTATAEMILTAAREAVKVDDNKKIDEASDSLLEFLQERTTDCPHEVAEAVFQAQAELSRIVAGQVVGSIASRTAQINAHLQDVQRTATKLEQQAALISLKPIRDAVDSGRELVVTLQEIRAELKDGGGDIDVAKVNAQLQQVTGDLDRILKSLAELKPVE